jgi:hypothetical protein
MPVRLTTKTMPHSTASSSSQEWDSASDHDFDSCLDLRAVQSWEKYWDLPKWQQNLSLIACLATSLRRSYQLGRPVHVELCIQHILDEAYYDLREKSLLPRVMDMGRFRNMRALGNELHCLYESTDRFVDDYISKAQFQHKPNPQTAVEVYNYAPWWADRGLSRRRSQTFARPFVPEATINLAMQSFLWFHIYCELHCMLDECNLKRESSLKKTAEIFQEQLNREFSRVLLDAELCGLRSVFWYTSTLWAILLDEIDMDEEYKDHCGLKDRRSLLWYLCSSGLHTLRQHLQSPPLQRKHSKSFSFPFRLSSKPACLASG